MERNSMMIRVIVKSHDFLAQLRKENTFSLNFHCGRKTHVGIRMLEDKDILGWSRRDRMSVLPRNSRWASVLIGSDTALEYKTG